MGGQGKLVSKFFSEIHLIFPPPLASSFQVPLILSLSLQSAFVFYSLITCEIFLGNKNVQPAAPEILFQWGWSSVRVTLKKWLILYKLCFKKWFCCIVRVENYLCRQDTRFFCWHRGRNSRLSRKRLLLCKDNYMSIFFPASLVI